MAVKNFIVAIELGSSQITGIAAKKDAEGVLQIIAVAQEPASNSVRKGAVYNIDKTAQSLTKIIAKLQQTLKVKIGKVYVGIGGLSLHTVCNTITNHMDSEVIVTQELIDEMMDNNLSTPYNDMEIIEVVPQEYNIGFDAQLDPVGILTATLKGNYLNIIARNAIRRNIIQSFNQAGIQIADNFVSPLALADVVLTDVQKRAGCALVDIGAQSTTVSIYKGNILRRLTVIPIGGLNITKDICSLEIDEEEAEALKINHGVAYTEPIEGEESEIIKLNDGRSLEKKTLQLYIEARMQEIILNVRHQITQCYEEDKLLAGIFITGGVANTKHIKEAFVKHTNFEKVEVAKGSQMTIKNAPQGFSFTSARANTIIGLLSKCHENCYGAEPEPTKEEVEQAIALKKQQEEEEAEAIRIANEKAAAQQQQEEAEKLAEAQREQAAIEAAEREAAAEVLRQQEKEEKAKKRKEALDKWKKNNPFKKAWSGIVKASKTIIEEE